MKVDDPAQYFFTQNVTSISTSELPQSQQIFSQYMKSAGITDTVKLVTIPLAASKILVRLENLADIFDGGQST